MDDRTASLAPRPNPLRPRVPRLWLAAAGIAVVAIAGGAILLGPFGLTGTQPSGSPSPTLFVATSSPAASPTAMPSQSETASPLASPTPLPTVSPTPSPTLSPTRTPAPKATEPSDAAAAVDGVGLIRAGFSLRGLWAVAGARRRLSTDGGETWTASRVPPDDDPALTTALAVADARHAWTLRDGAGTHITGSTDDFLALDVYRTADGGATWHATTIPGNFVGTRPNLVFADAMHGFLVVTSWADRKTVVYRTSDGGATWQAGASAQVDDMVLASDDSTLWGYAGGGQEMCWTCGEPLLQVSRDGGNKWSVVSLPGYAGKVASHIVGVTGIYFADSSTGVVAVHDADSAGTHRFTRIFRTVDGGLNWSESPRPAYSLDTLWPTDGEHWFAVTGGTAVSLIATDDGGVTWHVVSPWSNGWSVWFVDARHGAQLLPGQAGAILHLTSDGGHTWRRARFPAK